MISRESLRHRRRRGLKMYKIYHYCGYIEKNSPKEIDAILGKLGTTPVPCSCWMCCSPRRTWGNSKMSLTIQERIHNDILDYEYDEAC